MRGFRVSYFPRVNLLTKQHGQDLSPGHLRGLYHFIYGITVILCEAYFPENQLWGIMLLEMLVVICLPFLPPPNISVLQYTPVSQEFLVCPEPGPYLLGRMFFLGGTLFLGGTNTTEELIFLRQHWWPNARSLLRNFSSAISYCSGKPPATCPFTIDFWRPLLRQKCYFVSVMH